MRGLLITALVIVATLWGMARWLQPRMAFFPTRGVQATPAAAGLAFSELKISTSDGETLHGWWIEHPSPRAQVIYWHGNGGNLSMWMPVLADLGTAVSVSWRSITGATATAPATRRKVVVYRDAEAATDTCNQHLRRPNVPTTPLGTIAWMRRGVVCRAASAADGLILESPFPNVRSLVAGNPIMLALSFFSSYTLATSSHLEGYRSPLLRLAGRRGHRRTWTPAPDRRNSSPDRRPCRVDAFASTAEPSACTGGTIRICCRQVGQVQPRTKTCQSVARIDLGGAVDRELEPHYGQTTSF